MEPVRWGRDDAFCSSSCALVRPAAMEPVRWGRDDTGLYGQPLREVEPQWSPSAGDGTTCT